MTQSGEQFLSWIAHTPRKLWLVPNRLVFGHEIEVSNSDQLLLTA